MNFLVNFNVLLSKYIVHRLVKIKKTLYYLCSYKLKLIPSIFENGWDDDCSSNKQF